MIFDNIKNYKLYAGLNTGFREAFEFIGKTGFEKTAPGRYTLKGDVFYMVQTYETKPESDGFFEAHRKYIDLQYIVSGRERHIYANSSILKQRDPYDIEKDLVVYDGKGDSITLGKGFFAIYYPDDVHMPNLMTGENPEKMIKVVFKIPVSS